MVAAAHSGRSIIGGPSGSSSVVAPAGRLQAKKADVVEHPPAEGFDHVGLLVNEPPGTARLPFAQSSDDCDSTGCRGGPKVHRRSAGLLPRTTRGVSHCSHPDSWPHRFFGRWQLALLRSKPRPQWALNRVQDGATGRTVVWVLQWRVMATLRFNGVPAHDRFLRGLVGDGQLVAQLRIGSGWAHRANSQGIPARRRGGGIQCLPLCLQGVGSAPNLRPNWVCQLQNQACCFRP